jgi:ABC-type multidrug transport system fused ATPase/permease subunit
MKTTIRVDQRRAKRQKAIANQIRRLDNRITALLAFSRRLSWCRLIIFLIGGAMVFVSFFWVSEKLAGWVAGGAAIGFSITAWYHYRLGKGIRKYRIWKEIKKSQIERMTLDWVKIPQSILQAPPSGLSFEKDLDITGDRSIHQLIDICISRDGSRRLATWFLQKIPDRNDILKRQGVIRELVPLTRFRNRLLLNFRLASGTQLDGKKLLKWLQASQPRRNINRLAAVSFVLAALNLILFLWHKLGNIPPFWMLSLFIYIVFYLSNLKLLKQMFEVIAQLDDELGKFRQILQFLETYPYGENRQLKEMCAPFTELETLPSRQLRKIKIVSTAIGLRMNPIMALFLNIGFPWDVFFAALTQRYRNLFAEQLPLWLNVWEKLEASISLADFAYLNPEYTFPELICAADIGGQPVFEVRDMGHPLIPAAEKVCNDFSLDAQGKAVIITGSNMSGKSSFLKTIGINLCLAYAGGPVNAISFSSSLFRVYTCIKINDSIVEGFSFFYAEVRRLKTLLDALRAIHPLPLLFLIDEIFKGTNNRERLIGSRSYIQNLVGQNGTGLIATHDLELVKLADYSPQITNCHFREDVVDGKMVFDYKLRQGPCPTTNALKIMRMEGLPVE